MATLADLWHSVLPGARPVGPVGAGDEPIAWVRVLKPRVPAFDALDRGDLAIVPPAALAVVAPTREEVAALAAALAATPVAGVVIAGDAGTVDGGSARSADAGPDGGTGGLAGGGGTRRGGRDEGGAGGDPGGGGGAAASDGGAGGSEADLARWLADALARAGVPALVAEADPTVLERSAIGFLVNRRAELDRQATELERQVERLALAGRGAGALAAAIGAFLGRPVVIERRRGEPLAIHAPADQPASAALVARYHARPSAVPLRVPLPGADGRPVGALVILGDDGVGERERVACDRVSTLLALELARAGSAADAAPARGDALPPAGPPWVVIVARQDGEAGGTPIERREEMRRDVRLLGDPDHMALRGGAESLELRAVVATGPDDPDGLILAGRVASAIGRPIAVSRRFAEPSGRPVAEAEARATLEAIERLADPPRVARTERLAAYRLLGSLPDLPDAARQARALLEPLLVGGSAARRRRLETLRAVLDRDVGTDAAALLGVHRNTVAYRLRRIEQLGGWDLRDPDLRLALSMAVRIVQYEQSSTGPE